MKRFEKLSASDIDLPYLVTAYLGRKQNSITFSGSHLRDQTTLIQEHRRLEEGKDASL